MRNSYGRLYRSYGNWNPLRIVHFVLYDKARQGVDAQKQYAVANRLKNMLMVLLAFAFFFLSVIATGIIIWLNTKSGKKWLASL